MARKLFVASFTLVAVALLTTTTAEVTPHGGMLRYPDIGVDNIVFVYGNDIWLVPREGGMATPVASPPGQEIFPRLSPDGETIAFMGNYDGDRDLYTVPVPGGVPTRVTYHPSNEQLCDWTPDGELLYSTNGLAGLSRQSQLFTVPPEGGLPAMLPVPYGAAGAISPDGQWLAYTPYNRDFRTWKRYRGGMATDIWLFHLTDHTSKKITDWEGTDTRPMWHGKTVYYLSDGGPSHRLNIWAYDTETGERRQITDFEDFDVKWPSVGPGTGQGEIVFQNGADIYVLDLASGESTTVEITIPGDRPSIRTRTVNAADNLFNWDISATGKRAVFGARGDIWTVPAKDGSPRNLTRTSGVAERNPSWSPDGRWIAYFSDATGEYELYTTQSDGKGETRQLTEKGNAFKYAPTWSPDSKMIAYQDKTGSLFLHTLESGESRTIDRDPWGGLSPVSWSHDSGWIAYTRTGENRLPSIWLYDVENGANHQVTHGMFADTWPTFDRKGDYLFFASNRSFSSPVYEDVGTTFVYSDTDQLLFVPLRKDVKNPLLPESDEESWGDDDDDEEDDGEDEEDNGENDDDSAGDDDDKKDKKGKKKGKSKNGKGKDDEEEKEPLVIDLDEFEARAQLIPVDRGSFFNLTVNKKGQLIYSRAPRRGSTEEVAIKLFDFKKNDKGEREEKTVMEGTGSYVMSADGEKLLVRKRGRTFLIVDARASGGGGGGMASMMNKKSDTTLSLAGMMVTIDPRDEWRQIFNDAWRVQRDFFYDPNMHGVDWVGVKKHYEQMLDDCVSREDVSFVIQEMISELNVGHAYYFGGDVEEQPSISVGMLGVDFALDNGAYKMTAIYEGAPWDADARNPLRLNGVDVEAGDYLLAVNGVPVSTDRDPWAAFQGMAGRVVTVTVSEKPEIDDDARDVVVELLPSEFGLRYRAWVEANRAFVEEKTDGRVGYIYVPNTGVNGQNELFRQFFGQVDKEALIIDERWNGGGQIPTRFIELLNRPITNYWARRDGNDWPWPPDSHQGPKCMLINGLAGSGGDAFPHYFRQAGLGKLIGTRTWGGLVGISGNPPLIDGGYTSAPTFAFYENDGTWGIEGHGVDPDIEVVDDPAKMVDGDDPQLDAAIELMLSEIRMNGYAPPKRPAYPDRSGMGITEEDK